MKKIIAMLLVVVMAATAVPVFAASDTVTIYFDKHNSTWKEVYAYAFTISPESGLSKNADYPGVRMTHVNGTIYTIDISKDYLNIMFNNNNGSSMPSTTVPTDGKNLYTQSTEAWSTYAGFVPTGENSGTFGKADNYKLNVNGKFKSGSEADEVISVEIKWDAMSFTYNAASDGSWNPQTHVYTAPAGGGWSDNKVGITVTNHSNTGIKADFSFTAETGVNVDGAFYSKGEGNIYTKLIQEQKLTTLATAEGTATSAAPTLTRYFGIESGDAITETKKLGTITIKIASTTLSVGTKEELLTAMQEGGKARLKNDIDLGSDTDDVIPVIKDIVLDLNSHTLSGNFWAAPIMSVNAPAANVIVKNGTIENTNRRPNSTVVDVSEVNSITIENCFLKNVMSAALNIYDVNNPKKTFNIILKDTTIETEFEGSSQINVEVAATLEMSGNIRLLPDFKYVHNDSSTVIAKEGTYNFDPTQFVDTEVYTVTKNGDALWTVAVKQESM